jgi:chitodextrinase
MTIRTHWRTDLRFFCVVAALTAAFPWVIGHDIVHAATITVGDTSTGTSADSGNGNLLVSQQITLAQAATLQSLSFYVTKAAGKLRLGVYDSSGPSGGPGGKVAETAEITPTTGWNTAPVTASIALSPGTYWLAYLPSSSSLAFRLTPNGAARYFAFTYGVMPAVFSTTPNADVVHWSFYATLSTTPDTLPPSIPTNLVATPASTSQINLTWSASTDDVGVTAYNVYRNGKVVTTVPGTSYNDSGLSAATTYTYTVTALDAAGNESAQSAAVSATTMALDTTPPVVAVTAPAANAIVHGTSVAVSANASDNVAVAGVTFLVDGSAVGVEDTTSPYSIVWNTTTVMSGSHVVSAVARDSSGNTAQSAGVAVTVDNQPPTGTLVINGGAPATNSTSVTLTLSATDALSGVTQMRVSNTATPGTAQTYATSLPWILTAGAGTKTVYLQYMDGAGNWSGNFSSSIVYDTTAPTISGVAASNVTANGASISWTTNEGATSQVEYGTTSKYGTLSPVDSSLVLSHVVALSGLQPNTTYYFRPRSKDAAGNERIGGGSTFKTQAMTDNVPPSVPGGLSATPVSVSQIDVAWSASTDNVAVTGYRVFRNATQVATVTGTQYRDSGLSPNTTYSYTVSAYDAAGNESAAAGPVSATTLADISAPSQPTHLVATAISASQINLTWTASSDDVGVVGYQIVRNGNVVQSTANTAYSDTGLTAGTTYTYAVIAYDAAGNLSAPSAQVSATTTAPDTQPPTVPGSVTATAVSNLQINVGWAASTDNVAVANYIVLRDGAPIGYPTTTFFADSGLSANTTYVYTVAAVDTSGNASDQSSPVSATTLSSPAVPTFVQHVLVQSNQDFEAGNHFINALPNPVLGGNAVILGVTYAVGAKRTVAISDNIGTNTWTLLAGPVDDPTGTFSSAIYGSFNTAAGTQYITVSFDAPLFDFQAVASEWANVSAVNAVDGSAAGSVAAPNIAAGSITTTQANDLIYQYAIDTSWGTGMTGNTFTSYSPGTGFTLLAADHRIAVVEQYEVQPAAGAAVPTFKTAGGGADRFSTLAVALRAGAVGTLPDPNAMRIVSAYHTRVDPGTSTLNFPTIGNLSVLTTAYSENIETLNSVTDSKGNAWAVVVGSAMPQMAYAKNAASDPNLVLTLKVTDHGSGNLQLIIYDVVNADPNPLVQSAYASGTAAATDTVIPDAPDVTPHFADSLVFSAVGIWTGPPSNLLSPAGVFDSVYYTGATDLTPQDSGDAYGHYSCTSTAPLDFSWQLSNGGQLTGWFAAAWEFKRPH